MELLIGVTMTALILSIFGCASLSSCRYRSTGIVVFPAGEPSPLLPSLADSMRSALTPLGFTGGVPRALPNGNPFVGFSIGGWPQMFGERIDVGLDLKAAQVTIFDFNNSTGSPASKFDQQIMNALEERLKDDYRASIQFKPCGERFCLGP
jgi:hypothetical protein